MHILDNWTWTVYQLGLTSGTLWVANAVSPSQWNIRLEKGEVSQFVSNGGFKPVGGHGTEWFGGGRFKLTINANNVTGAGRDSGHAMKRARPSAGFFVCGRG